MKVSTRKMLTLWIAFLTNSAGIVQAFTPPSASSYPFPSTSFHNVNRLSIPVVRLHASPTSGDNDSNAKDRNRDEKLAKLGYSEQELQRVEARSNAKNDDKVRVNLIPEIDSVTLTAIGFGLIAFNFFVLANLGDGGIGGILATIINKLNE
ncbi:predicted protein [Phaeodactylum tricornutum CCAP 1055/1]|jgi:hypothetical protein|uniref:Uncharacterized protein n=2 Tax=Phaeodactylum tricornutum TaxID=2850 RepID=B7G8G0_PHATC|nr:predicted protein [Phaeodactylum tricornutum CCAP 1055/1]EEC45039.1 predicted protein [Phaeodactylum tricornutum CCAP 1055/1]|eukprot:XP_002183339.1 predicted protein [Phaeodactylum tricornutum CCAP 1055/1]